MILEATFPCAYLLLTSGYSIYVLRKYSQTKYSTFLPRFAIASVGIASIGIRSLYALVYKLFIKAYTLDPFLMEIEEEKNRSKLNIFDELLNSTASASLLSSLYFHHGYYVTGTLVVGGLSIIDILRLIQEFSKQEEENGNTEENLILSCARSLPKEIVGILTSSWIFCCGFFAWLKNNNYGLLALYPYTVTIVLYPPEGFYQGWSLHRTINNYMMMIYIILMTEALRRE